MPTTTHEEDRVEAFKRICQRSEMRLTHQRLEILRLLSGAKDHPSAEDLYEQLRPTLPTLSLDTVYRTLAALEAAGELARLQIDTRARFDPNPHPHCHFVCIRCRRILDFEWPEFEALSKPSRARRCGRTLRVQAQVEGICTQCLRKEAPKS